VPCINEQRVKIKSAGEIVFGAYKIPEIVFGYAPEKPGFIVFRVEPDYGVETVDGFGVITLGQFLPADGEEIVRIYLCDKGTRGQGDKEKRYEEIAEQEF
jgi:hypothetical protein